MNTQFRQGDVFVVATTDQLPADVRPVQRDDGRVVLAYGEVTGHAHAIADSRAELYEDLRSTDRWLVIRSAGAEAAAPVALVHEEHAPITLAPGTYRVRRQREYAPESVRQVAD